MLLKLENKEKSALRQAIMYVKPEYFSWSQTKREQYHISKPAKERFCLQQILLKELFNIQISTEEELDTARDAFNDEHQFIFNKAILPISGIGQNSFFLNEYLAEGTTILDFETVYDYSYDDHCFQEKTRKEEDSQYIIKPYRGDLHFTWARLMVDGIFYYATLSSMASYLHDTIDSVGSDKINELMPHKYVKGRDYGKKEGRGFLLDLQVDANGMELQLEELQRRFWKYLSERYQTLLDECTRQARKCVYIFDKSKKNDPHMDFVFSDKSALKAVSFKQFIADCQQIIGDNQQLKVLETQEIGAIVSFLEEEYQDILENFDSKIIKFRKKRKIVVAQEAVKDFF